MKNGLDEVCLDNAGYLFSIDSPVKVQYCSGDIMKQVCTVKFLNFRMQENIAVVNLKFKQRCQTLGYFTKKDANGIANSEDPDQTAPLGAFCPDLSVRKFLIITVLHKCHRLSF